MRAKRAVFVITVLVSVGISSAAQPILRPMPQLEMDALADLCRALNRSSSTTPASFNTTWLANCSDPNLYVSLCSNSSKSLVVCTADNGFLHVSSLGVQATWHPFFGTLPPTIGNFSYLQILCGYDELTFIQALNDASRTVPNAYFGGPIPAAMGNLANLTYLDIFGNNFTGTVPEIFGALTNLNYLDISGLSSITGSFPASIGELVNLSTLHVSNVALTGTLPSNWAKLNSTLVTLYLTGLPNLTGGIPSWLGSFPKLQSLNLWDTGIGGTIPSELFLLPELISLDVGNNGHVGTVPPEIGLAPKLENVALGDNPLVNGTIPPEIGNAPRIWQLGWGYMGLSGAIPVELILKPALHPLVLELRNNQLSGTVPAAIASRPISFLDVGLNPGIIGCIPELTLVDVAESFQITGCLIDQTNVCCSSLPNSSCVRDNGCNRTCGAECVLTNCPTIDDPSSSLVCSNGIWSSITPLVITVGQLTLGVNNTVISASVTVSNAVVVNAGNNNIISGNVSLASASNLQISNPLLISGNLVLSNSSISIASSDEELVVPLKVLGCIDSLGSSLNLTLSETDLRTTIPLINGDYCNGSSSFQTVTVIQGGKVCTAGTDLIGSSGGLITVVNLQGSFCVSTPPGISPASYGLRLEFSVIASLSVLFMTLRTV